VRSWRGQESSPYQKRYRAGYAPPPATVSPTPTSAAHAISETKWTFGNTSATLEFLPDGKIKSIAAGKETTGKWIAVNVGTVKNATGSSTYSLSFDQKTLTQTNAGKAYVWNRVAGASAATPGITAASSQNSAPKGAITVAGTRTPAEEWLVLKQQRDVAFKAAFASVSKGDKAALLRLKQNIGTKDMVLLEKIGKALDAVANDELFNVPLLTKPQEKAASSFNREFYKIFETRDKNWTRTLVNVSGRFRSAYDNLLKRALKENALPLAKEIKSEMELPAILQKIEGTYDLSDLSMTFRGGRAIKRGTDWTLQEWKNFYIENESPVTLKILGDWHGDPALRLNGRFFIECSHSIYRWEKRK
jgi:hypothetical protein